ncbi:hypothetical protein DFH29DRAFT_911218 [Suillus ampliporus]|nr:hypothetical protein DFH29DRAFT_911218 [Suillus ampliporus]
MTRHAQTMQATSTAHAASYIPRPSDADFRHLQHSNHSDIVRALDMTPDAFEKLKVHSKKLREEMQASLDSSKKFADQDPSAWSRFVQWARETMPSLLSRYEDAWPVELYVRINLMKHVAYERHRFKKAMAKYKQTRVLRSSSSTAAAEMSPADPPPPYEEEEDPATGSEDCGSQMHPDAVLENIENFLKSCDFDLGHLTGAFVTRRAGLFNLERLELIASWPAALRRDHLERHFGTMLDDVEIEVLNKRFIEMNRAQL